ncbi:hypothetical protein [Neisseria sicca]|uniref:Uncharacterized protein n=1 Tax=Neisseria sicca VK64 TaxID=1095748 RepID=I2NVK6_NEISI|nr:hypothetical protein [Neisseria sicca]EIG29867.1 hypothetical protein HMPREF1051_2813 [Neisseria sicca VK64]
MRYLIPLFFLSFPLATYAGGDSSKAQVLSIVGSHGYYQISVRQIEHLIYDDGCTTYNIRITPPRKTFWDLLGLRQAGDHPTAEQTQAAAAVLKQYAANQHPLEIGYLGGGLYPDPQQKCLYHGTGMRFYAPGLFSRTPRRTYGSISLSDQTISPSPPQSKRSSENGRSQFMRS